MAVAAIVAQRRNLSNSNGVRVRSAASIFSRNIRTPSTATRSANGAPALAAAQVANWRHSGRRLRRGGHHGPAQPAGGRSHQKAANGTAPSVKQLALLPAWSATNGSSGWGRRSARPVRMLVTSSGLGKSRPSGWRRGSGSLGRCARSVTASTGEPTRHSEPVAEHAAWRSMPGLCGPANTRRHGSSPSPSLALAPNVSTLSRGECIRRPALRPAVRSGLRDSPKRRAAPNQSVAQTAM
jgi:hypothetical protein